DVRLSGGHTPFEGRVEIRRDNGEWGLVCAMNAQNWDSMEARVVCKQLGFVDVMWTWSNSEYGVSNLPVRVCDISCDVSATSLNDCTISSTGSFPGFLGRYKEGNPNRIFQTSSNMYTIGNSITTIQGCIQTCRDNSKPIAVLHSADECYCGDDDTDYRQYGEAVPGEMINEYVFYGTLQCSGDTGTEPYIQGCGGDYQLDVYDTTIGSCGGQYTDDSGYIYSPNFPDEYPVDQSCIWTITVEDNHIIQLSLLMYKISIGDYLDIRDGSDVTAPQITRNSMTVFSSGNILWLQFYSNSDMNTDLGFALTYQALPQCSKPQSVYSHVMMTPFPLTGYFNPGDSIGDTLKYSSTPSEGSTVIRDTTLKPSVSSNRNEEETDGNQCNQKGANPGVYVGFGIVTVVMAVAIVTLVLLYRRARLKPTGTEEREMTNLDKSNDRTYQDLITTDGVDNAYQALNYHDEKNKTDVDYVSTPRPGCYEEIELGQDVSKRKNVRQQQADDHYANSTTNIEQDEIANVSEIREALIVLQKCVTAYDVTTDNEKKGEMSHAQKAMTT
ncbi:scavenger receptor cysteine-rich domain-containing protein DMBT1-like, partial [Saccoglossus kowalevskii]